MTPFTTSEIKPRGWLLRQLRIQAAGLSGHLHEVWPDVRDSAWIGGDREGWERVPYWLDGYIPMAYLLDDQQMIATAKKYIDAIIAGQNPDGWICPCEPDARKTYDTWAVQLISKVLTVYYECAGDERIPGVLYRLLRNYYDLLQSGTITLFDWGKYRWFETFYAILFVYKRTGEAWLPELGKLLRSQGYDYREAVDRWKKPIYHWTFETHIVNIGMMLKAEALTAALFGEQYTDSAEVLRSVLALYNGTPVGLFTGDECLAGLSPIHGTELCAVVEQMFSYELLCRYTGDMKWAERLELLAFNALPATFSDDMWTHQYDQLSNQNICSQFPGKPYFATNGGEAHLFGLEPNYGCCTANLSQGWPKFICSLFARNASEVLQIVPAPATLNCELCTVDCDTEYPFKNSFIYTVTAKKDFCLKIRIPSFAEKLRYNQGVFEDGFLKLVLGAGEEKQIKISYETTPHMLQRPHELFTVQCGSLVFSHNIPFEAKPREYTRDGVTRQFPYCDYEYLPKADWNYGFADTELCKQEQNIGDVPFSSVQPPVTITAHLQKIDWDTEDGYESLCAKLPRSTVALAQPETVNLTPYGCAKLRMTEMPMVRAHPADN